MQSKRTRAVFRGLTGKTKLERWEGELKVSRPDKKSFWAHVIVRPIEPASDLVVGFLIILTDVTQRVELESKLTQLTVTDDLTGIYNQRHFLEQLRREMERANRRNQSFRYVSSIWTNSVFNDTYGHVAGIRSSDLCQIVSRPFVLGLTPLFAINLPGYHFFARHASAKLLSSWGLRRPSGRSLKPDRYQCRHRGYNQVWARRVCQSDRLMYLAKRKGGDKVVVEMTKKLSRS